MKNHFEAMCRQQPSICENDFSDPEIHVIDNFQLEVKQNAEGEIQTAEISFLLMPDHGLKRSHCAYVFDVYNPLSPILIFQCDVWMWKNMINLIRFFPKDLNLLLLNQHI